QPGEAGEDRAPHVREHDWGVSADAGESRDVGIATHGKQVVPEARSRQANSDNEGEGEHEDRRDGNWPHAGGSEELELPGYGSGCALVCRSEVSLEDQPHP